MLRQYVRLQSFRKWINSLLKLFQIITIPIDYSSGGETDWMYAVQNVSLSYTFEFRDKGMKCGHRFQTDFVDWFLYEYNFRKVRVPSTSVYDSSKLSRIHWWTQSNDKRGSIIELLSMMKWELPKQIYNNEWTNKFIKERPVLSTVFWIYWYFNAWGNFKALVEINLNFNFREC